LRSREACSRLVPLPSMLNEYFCAKKLIERCHINFIFLHTFKWHRFCISHLDSVDQAASCDADNFILNKFNGVWNLASDLIEKMCHVEDTDLLCCKNYLIGSLTGGMSPGVYPQIFQEGIWKFFIGNGKLKKKFQNWWGIRPFTCLKCRPILFISTNLIISRHIKGAELKKGIKSQLIISAPLKKSQHLPILKISISRPRNIRSWNRENLQN